MSGFSVAEVLMALGVLSVLVLAGANVRRHVPFLRDLFIPNAVTAGFIGLFLGDQVLGNIVDDGRLSEGLWGEDVLAVWATLPGLLINVVFAAILLGKDLPGLRSIWRQSAPQVLFGATLSFGQYALGALLALVVLVPVFDLPELSGGLLEISFTGGHGTAAGLSDLMVELGFEEGPDLALGLATVGLVAGILMGTFLINRAVRSDDITIAREEELTGDEDYELSRVDLRDVPAEFEPDPATSPLTIAIAAISLAVTLGWLLHQALIGIEVLLTDNPADDTFIGDIPLFPFTIIGGAALQVFMVARGWSDLVPRDVVNQVSGLALDLLIAASIVTLSLSTIGDNGVAFLLMVIVALGWSLLAFLFIAPRMYGARWYERALGDTGQSSGTVASGFLLIDMADPDDTSGAKESYGYKQLLFEPFLGGGLITALALPLIDRMGLGLFGVVAAFLTVSCIWAGVRMKASLEES